MGFRRYRWAAILTGLTILVCLACGAIGLVLFQFPAGSLPLPFLRVRAVQAAADASHACSPPSHLVPGSYQAEPVQTIGGYVVVTFTADCDQPGGPTMSVAGYAAIGSHGDGCGGSGTSLPVQTLTTGPVTIDSIAGGGCGSAAAGGALDVVTGRVTGAGAVSAQVQYASGAQAAGPIRNGRFAVAAPEASAICAVCALDAGGQVLAVDNLSACHQ